MRIEPKPRSVRRLFRVILLLLLGLGSAYYHLQQSRTTSKVSGNQALLSIVPSVPAWKPAVQAEKPKPVVTTIPIERNQTFSDLMTSLGIDTQTTHAVYEGSKDVYNLAQIRAGKSLVVSTTQDKEFAGLEYSIDPTQTLVVRKAEGEIQAELLRYTPETQVHELGGEIQGSLYGTIDRLGEGDELVASFAGIFEWDVDFFRELQAGDTFRIIYEKQTIRGEPYGYGKILAAQLNTKGREYTAVGFQHGKQWEFFSPDGKAMKKAFLASPLKFTRISSGFNPRRFHPILKRYRPHYGVDYAAPTGTPVRAIGNGTITMAGWGGGLGKTVKIKHNNEITTMYGHLSRIASGMRNGVRVSQGQVIGYVGSTGLSTAPHLDFRFLKNGRYVNFLSVRPPQAEPLNATTLAEFRNSTGEILGKLKSVPILPAQPAVEYATFYTPELRFSEDTL